MEERRQVGAKRRSLDILFNGSRKTNMNEVIISIRFPYGSVNPDFIAFPVSFDSLPKRHRAAAAQRILGELVAINPVQDKTVSVDTIAISVEIEPLRPNERDRLGFKPVCRFKKGKLRQDASKRWQLHFKSITGATVRVTYTQKGGHWLTVEVSLPKFLYGSNFWVLNYAERIEAVKELSTAVSERLEFMIDLLDDGKGKRLDLFQHVRLGSDNNVRLGIGCLKELGVNNRNLEKNNFSDSAAWRNTGKKKLTHRLQIYNKSIERRVVGESIPDGILKIESQFRDARLWRGQTIRELLTDENLRRLYFPYLWKR
jgi:hypothetical protein